MANQALSDQLENTEVAYAHMSDQELTKSIWVFRMLALDKPARYLGKLASWMMQKGVPLQPIVRTTVFSQFCGGESIESCVPAIEKLASHNVGTIVDYSAESGDSEEDFDQTTEEIIKAIDLAANDPWVRFAVFKFTGLSTMDNLEKIALDSKIIKRDAACAAAYNRGHRICQYAFEKGVKVFIDGEHSWIQDGIDFMAESYIREFNHAKPVVFTTLQMYRHDRLNYLQKLIHEAKDEGHFVGVKLVRGAYMEIERDRAENQGYQSPICSDKQATDKSFDDGLALILENLDCVSACIGTHNKKSCVHAVESMQSKNIELGDRRIEFSQLFGMSDVLSYNLVHLGCSVSKYLPYGPIVDVMPYLIRRADENTAIQGQTSRELAGFEAEYKRRKKVRHSQTPS